MRLLDNTIGQTIVGLSAQYPLMDRLWKKLLAGHGYNAVIAELSIMSDTMSDTLNTTLGQLCYDLFGLEAMFNTEGQDTEETRALWPYFPVTHEEVLALIPTIDTDSQGRLLATLLNQHGWVTREFYERDLWAPFGEYMKYLKPTYELANYLLVDQPRDLNYYRARIREHLIEQASHMGHEDLLAQTRVESDVITEWRLRSGIGIETLRIKPLTHYSLTYQRLIAFRGAQFGRTEWIGPLLDTKDRVLQAALVCGGYDVNYFANRLPKRKFEQLRQIPGYQANHPHLDKEESLKVFAPSVYKLVK